MRLYCCRGRWCFFLKSFYVVTALSTEVIRLVVRKQTGKRHVLLSSLSNVILVLTRETIESFVLFLSVLLCV